MDLNHLQTYCAVVEWGSISKAARKLYVTQPAVSVKIQELEDYYGVKLLDRTNKGVNPTAAGLIIYEESQKIFGLLASAQRRIELLSSPQAELKVAASETIGNYALPCTLFVFKERYPHYAVNLEVSNSDQVLTKMTGQKAEIGMMEGPLDSTWRETLQQAEISIKKIARDQLVLVTPGKGLFNRDHITLEEICKVPLILCESGSGVRRTVLRVLEDCGLKLSNLNVVLELNSINAVVSAVTSGKGLSILPKMVVRKEVRYKIFKPVTIKQATFHHDFTLLFFSREMKRKGYEAFVRLVSSKERGFC